MQIPAHQTELEKVLSSTLFARAGRQARLLRYVVEKTAAGAELKEYTLALEVFERPPTYDPRVDSVVRVEAAKLRARLEKYYQTEGAADRIRFSIPKGSYAVQFETVHTPAAARRRPVRPAAIGTALALALAAAVAIFAFRGPSRLPATVAAPQPSLAVLPFSTDGQSNGRAFADGLTDEVTTQLARLPGWKVASRTSAAQFAGQKADIRAIGEKLNVHAVLEGRVRTEPGRARVTAELVDAADGFVFWNDSWEHEFTNAVDGQRFLADAVVKAFRSRLTGARRALVRRASATKDAYQQYLRASVYAIDDEPEAMQHSLRLLKVAVATDPRYALAWAGIARQLLATAEQEFAPTQSVCGPARDAVARAAAIDPDLVETRIASAWHHMLCEWDWTRAEQDFRRAIELDPSFVAPLHEYGRMLVVNGRFTEAAAAFEKALGLAPQWNWLLNGLANAYIKAGKFEEAEKPLSLSCGQEPLPGCLTRRGIIAAAQGRHDDAVDLYRQALLKQPTNTWSNGHLGYSLASLGQRNEAEALIRRLQQPLTDRPVPEYEIAAVYSGLGDKEKALEWLERALRRRSPTVMYAGVDFRFSGLRAEPRFRQVLRELHLPLK